MRKALRDRCAVDALFAVERPKVKQIR